MCNTRTNSPPTALSVISAVTGTGTGDEARFIVELIAKNGSTLAGSASNRNPGALAFRYIDGYEPLLRCLLWKLRSSPLLG